MVVHRQGGPRFVEVPAHQLADLREIVNAQGLGEAQRFSGLGRVAILGGLARGKVTPGVAAQLELAFQRRRVGAR
jgi:hypothetical protein